MAQCTFSWHSCKLCLSYSSHFHFVLFQHRAFFLSFAAEHNLYVTLDMMESRRVDSSHVVHKQLCNLSNFAFCFFSSSHSWMPSFEGCAIEKKVERLRTLVNVRECLCTTGRMNILVHIQYPLNENEKLFIVSSASRYSNILFKVVFFCSLSCSSFDYKLSWCCCLQLYSEGIPKEEKIKISFWMQLLFPCFSYFVFLLLLLLMRLMILLFADDANGMKHRRECKIQKGKLKIVHSTF